VRRPFSLRDVVAAGTAVVRFLHQTGEFWWDAEGTPLSKYIANLPKPAPDPGTAEEQTPPPAFVDVDDDSLSLSSNSSLGFV
jgi:hypothetical protein